MYGTRADSKNHMWADHVEICGRDEVSLMEFPATFTAVTNISPFLWHLCHECVSTLMVVKKSIELHTGWPTCLSEQITLQDSANNEPFLLETDEFLTLFMPFSSGKKWFQSVQKLSALDFAWIIDSQIACHRCFLNASSSLVLVIASLLIVAIQPECRSQQAGHMQTEHCVQLRIHPRRHFYTAVSVHYVQFMVVLCGLLWLVLAAIWGTKLTFTGVTSCVF